MDITIRSRNKFKKRRALCSNILLSFDLVTDQKSCIGMEIYEEFALRVQLLPITTYPKHAPNKT